MPTLNTHRYYRSVIVPSIREHCGYVSDAEAHRHIKAGFLEMNPNDPKLPSMSRMTQDEASRLIDYAIMQAAKLNLILPDPRREPEDPFDAFCRPVV